MEAGTIVRFDDVRGYGFISPDHGGDDVFVHANDFGDERHLVAVGQRARYEVAQSDRGPKVATVILEPALSGATTSAGPGRADPERTRTAPVDDGECDVLDVGQFRASVTDLLLDHVPTMTGAQIVAARRALLAMARKHCWVED